MPQLLLHAASLILITLGGIAAALSPEQSSARPLYLDATQTVAARVADLVSDGSFPFFGGLHRFAAPTTTVPAFPSPAVPGLMRRVAAATRTPVLNVHNRTHAHSTCMAMCILARCHGMARHPRLPPHGLAVYHSHTRTPGRTRTHGYPVVSTCPTP